MAYAIKCTVLPGRGKGVRRVNRLDEKLRQKLGAVPYPGTLNLVAREPVRFARNKNSEYRIGRKYLYPAEIRGTKVWVYRWKNAPYHVFEIMSEHKLRDKLKLADHAECELVVRDGDVVSLNFLQRLFWNLFWKDREGDFYSNSRRARLGKKIQKVVDLLED